MLQKTKPRSKRGLVLRLLMVKATTNQYDAQHR